MHIYIYIRIYPRVCVTMMVFWEVTPSGLVGEISAFRSHEDVLTGANLLAYYSCEFTTENINPTPT